MNAADPKSTAEFSANSAFGSLLVTKVIKGNSVTAWLSTEVVRPDWDDYLRVTSKGQFQQSSLWAQVKESGGWQVSRVLLEQEDRIIGGFQLLSRRTRFGRIGFVNKGPVLSDEEPELVTFTLDLLSRLIRSQRLLAIVVQPADESALFPSSMVSRGFTPDLFMGIISATCMVDLTGPPGEWERNLGRSKKVELRQAIRRGVTVREGDEADVPKFFELMSSTCVRQGVKPNPSTVEELRKLVVAFRVKGSVKLSFAECQGETVAGVLDLRFGNRVTTWKKGWNGAHADAHPNILLVYQSIRNAQESGYRHHDFAGMNRDLAETLLAQKPLTEEQKKHRDAFHLAFGAQPRLLPGALIYWRNPLVRFLYAKAARWPLMVSRLSSAGKRLGSP